MNTSSDNNASYFMKSFILTLLASFLFISCGKSEPTVQSQTYTLKTNIVYAVVNKIDSVNYIVLKAKTQGTCSSITWDFGDGETQQGDSVVTHYFPKKGTYSIRLAVVDFLGATVSDIKDIVINADDPAYVPHKLIWSDEFDGTTLNTANWTNETNIDVNNEWQTYTNGSNLTIKDGMLTITAKKVGAGQKKGDYTSGRINSNGLRTFLYGRMEIRAKLPAGRGTWPATWMLGTNIATAGWPACGELDIMEHVGYNPLWVKGSIHTPSSYGNTVNNADYKLVDCESAFHVYGMTWTPSKIEYYVDDPDHPYYTYSPTVKNASTWPFNKPCFFILNLAIGGNWGGAQGVDDSIFPCSMQVDYVRVFNYK